MSAAVNSETKAMGGAGVHNEPPSRRFRLISILILFTLTWAFASTYYLSSLAIRGFEPVAAGAWRIIVASVLLSVVAYILGPGLVKTAAQWRAAAIYGIGCFSVPFLTLPWMLQYLSSTTLAIYYAGIPLFILVMSWIFLKTPISKQKWVGFFVGSVGLVTLATVGVDAGSAVAKPDAIIPLLPHVVCVMTAIFLAGGAVYFQALPRMSPLSMTASAFVAANVVAVPTLIVSTILHPPLGMPSAIAITGMMGTAVIATALGTLLRGILIRREGAIFTSINAYIIPVNTGIIGVLFLGETISLANIAAFCLIVIGLLIARRS
jgi:drug/metabolite transporter (DMT)-like permease